MGTRAYYSAIEQKFSRRKFETVRVYNFMGYYARVELRLCTSGKGFSPAKETRGRNPEIEIPERGILFPGREVTSAFD